MRWLFAWIGVFIDMEIGQINDFISSQESSWIYRGRSLFLRRWSRCDFEMGCFSLSASASRTLFFLLSTSCLLIFFAFFPLSLVLQILPPLFLKYFRFPSSYAPYLLPHSQPICFFSPAGFFHEEPTLFYNRVQRRWQKPLYYPNMKQIRRWEVTEQGKMAANPSC